jgi:YgiT-type zinc finger domain-containing protein
MAQCPLCGGEKKQGKTTYSVDLKDGVVVVRDVPAQICSQCGEEWIDAQTAQALEKIVNEAKKRACQVEVLSF